MRLDVIKAGADDTLAAAEKEASAFWPKHETFLATIDGDVAKAAERACRTRKPSAAQAKPTSMQR